MCEQNGYDNRSAVRGKRSCRMRKRECFGTHAQEARNRRHKIWERNVYLMIREYCAPPPIREGTPLQVLPTSSPLAGKRIVTVEDESITQMQLRKVLTRAGLIVVGQAMNGKDGVDLILREKPDLVTMDITMPIMDGLEATRQVMEKDDTCVVIVTAYTNEEYRQKAEEVGASGYVVKPIAAASLLPALEYIYEHRKVH